MDGEKRWGNGERWRVTVVKNGGNETKSKEILHFLSRF